MINPLIKDIQIPTGTTVLLGTLGLGRVVREYTMPDSARADAYWAYSHPGARIYVVRLNSGEELAVGAGELSPQA